MYFRIARPAHSIPGGPGDYYASKPSINEMLDYEVLDLREAAFILTGLWPKYLTKCFFGLRAKKRQTSRSFIYTEACPPNISHSIDFRVVQSLGWQFNPNELGPFFLYTYRALKDAVDCGKIPARMEHLGFSPTDQVCILVPTNDVIRWALEAGINVQEELLKTKEVYLQDRTHNEKIMKNVVIKIKYQFLRHYFPGERGTFYYKHELLGGSGIIGRDAAKDKYQVIRKVINELRDPNRSRCKGNRSTEKIKKESYYPKAINEVVYTDSSGIQRYHIPLLRVAIEAAVSIFHSMYFAYDPPIVIRGPASMDPTVFLHDFMQNEIVTLYTKNAPPIILEFVKDFAERVVENFFR
jgi:hypothetical protein